MARLDAGLSPKHLDAGDLALYGVTVLVWGTSWIAIRMQLGVVAPEVSTLWRFLLAAVVMLGWAAWRQERMAFPAGDHLCFAAVGILLFSTNFVLFYYAGLTVTTGLLAVAFSLASVINLALGAIVLRQRVEPRVALGGLLGVVGVAFMFAPQIAGAAAGAVTGLGLAIAGTLSFCLGNLVSTFIQRRQISIVAANSWGMVYGVIALALWCLATGQSFTVEATLRYWGSLVYLALFASVVAFASYLTLLRRIGPARAGYATVLFPVVALTVSTFAEDYRWTAFGALGALCALAGNWLVLGASRRGRRVG